MKSQERVEKSVFSKITIFWHLLGLRSAEYPKVNYLLKKRHLSHWEKYYQCLKQKYLKIGPNKTIPAVSLMAFQDTSVV